MKAVEVRALLDRHGLRLHRDRGQNFLLGESHADRLAVLAGVQEADTVIEVGTGLGALTRALASRASRVVTIEVDAGLVRALESESLLPDNCELLHADAREVDFAALASAAPGPCRLVANLPYSVATPLLRQWLDLDRAFVDWSVMVQREVAARLLAETGSRDYDSLSVLHRLCVDVELATQLGGDRFYPAARIRSSFLRMTPHAAREVDAPELRAVEKLLRSAFGQRRKMIGNSLAEAVREAPGAFEAAGVSPRDRPQSISADQWLALVRALSAATRTQPPSPGC